MINNITRRAFSSALIATPSIAFAGSYPLNKIGGRNLQISPTLINLGPEDTSAICSVWNNGTVPTTSQIRLMRWTQRNGKNILTPTDEVAASPPTMTVNPGDRQVVRIVNLSAKPRRNETAFRLLLNELPSSKALSGSGVQVLIAFSVPVFLGGTASAPPRLSANIVHIGKQTFLRVHNHGSIHARIVNLDLKAGNRIVFRKMGLDGYVLPETYFDIQIPNSAAQADMATMYIQTTSSPINLRIGA
jgi:fimbrial chaperone protein